MDLATRTPAEIDTQLRQLGNDHTAANANADRLQIAVNRAAGDKRDRAGHWQMSAAVARDKAHEIATTQRGTLAGNQARTALAVLNAQLRKVSVLQHEMNTLHAEFDRRGGWTRAYLAVTNGRGHIHSSQRCSTCNNGQYLTRFYWFAELSGADEAEIVRQAGSDACTTCYPDAPVEDRNRPSSLFTPDEIQQQRDREQRRADLAAKKAAAAAKAITNPDGSELRDSRNQVIKTERTAEIAAVDALVDDELYEFHHPEAQNWRSYFDRAVAALAAKRGLDKEEVRATLQTKAQKKVKKLRPVS